MEFRNLKRKVDRQLARDRAKRAKRARLDNIRRVVEANYSDSENDADQSDVSEEESIQNDHDNESDGGEGEPQDEMVEGAAEIVFGEAVVDEEDVNPIQDEPAVQVPDQVAEDAGFSSIASNNSEGSASEEDGFEDNVFANDEERGIYVRDFLRSWACEGGVLSLSKVDSLLKGLKPIFPCLPLSYKTLLNTPTSVPVRELGGGRLMWYKGIATNLKSMLLHDYLDKFGRIVFDVNMDGLPLFRSSSWKFWPILGRLVGSENSPFVIAVYVGKTDPEADTYLLEFVTELILLQREGFDFNGVVYPVSTRHFILDAPARSLVKACVGHGGYGACEKCTDFGEYIDDRTVYLNLDAPLRTDESFRNREDLYHHIGQSLLEVAGIGFITQFRLDSFHLVWHGVFKRLVTVWDTWPGVWKWKSQKRDRMTAVLATVAETCPCDFCRLPRPIREWHYYKGTEERRLCLYDGLLVFRDELPPNVYRHYLLLHAALYILASPELVQTLCNYAGTLLRTFISHSSVIYGRNFVVYNVHSLNHLAKECEDHGPLDSFSAFDFENALKTLKETLHSGYKPLIQAAFRDAERTRAVHVKMATHEKNVELSMQHSFVEPNMHGSFFWCVKVGNVKLKCDKINSCFCTQDGDIAVLKNINKRHNNIRLIGQKFMLKEDFYTYPLPSSSLGIYKVSELSGERTVFNLESVKAKCWLMMDGDSYLCVPLLHTSPLF